MQLLRSPFYRIIENAQKKKLIIFGKHKQAENLYKKLKLLDVHIEYFADDVDCEEYLCGLPVKNYNELLYEESNSFLVIIFDDLARQNLSALGLREPQDFRQINLFSELIPSDVVLDSNLGYNISSEDNYSGFIQFGDSNPDYTIVTLGGSTTDATNTVWPSWSELLWRKLKQRGYKVQILCGGVTGYQTSQELIKLIRDVIPMKPELVICYDGFNDINNLYLNTEHPFVHPYQKEIVKTLRTRRQLYLYTSEGYTLGVDSGYSSYQLWKNSVRMMHAICDEYKIPFIDVLQPSIYDKFGNMGKKDWEVCIHNELRDGYLEIFDDFSKEKQEDHWEPDYVVDMRKIFDGIDGIYHDNCHVWEKGNDIIADNMLPIVLQNLQVMGMQWC